MDLSSTIAPKSDQLNADDLLTGPRTFTIEKVTQGTAEQPVNIHLTESPGRPWKPSKSMRRVLVSAWGPDGNTYNGRHVTLYRNPDIKFGGDTNNNGQRTDQLLEAMYQWARFMGVKYDCAIIANSQVSADGDGLQYPTLPMLKDSKTGKQGAADVILTGGAVNDPLLANSRYWGTTKNKKVRTGQRSSPNVEMILQGDRARYIEAPT